MTAASNPLLKGSPLVPFGSIGSEHVVPGVRRAIAEARDAVDRIAESREEPSWENTLAPLEAAGTLLQRRVAPVAHLVSVAETPGLRSAYNVVLPEITVFWTDTLLREDLWRRVSAAADAVSARPKFGPDAAKHSLRRRHAERTANAFRRAGAQLGTEKKDRLRELRVRLVGLEQRFAENVLDATSSFRLIVRDRSRLAGIPEDAVRRAKARAEAAGESGWLFGLDQPAVEAVMKHGRDRNLRRELYIPYAQRCREGEHANTPLVARILRIRDEIAHGLGYEDFADYQLEERMAQTGSRAMEFEEKLIWKVRPYWKRDVARLRKRAAEAGADPLEPWDAAYFMEELRRERYELDAESLRPYYPLPKVLDGLFEIARRTFGFTVERRPNSDVWHPEVEFFEVKDPEGRVAGYFYADWFPRPEKRPGAWMCDLATGGPQPDGSFVPHLAAICANFAPPDGDVPALLRHRDVCTVLHEFGHLLHHMASRVEIPSRAGINVAWDWVELPSQLMENWAWEEGASHLLSGHHRTGEPLPGEIFDRLNRTRSFMGGWSMMRQLAFATVDLSLHTELAKGLRVAAPGLAPDDGDDPDPQGERVMAYATERFRRFSPSRAFAELHPLASFLHVFAGGYAAGYYSYMWSAVLEADAFSRFRKEGIFDRETGRRFVDAILSRGDSAHPGLLFHDFMGRPPDLSALLDRELGPPPEPATSTSNAR